MKEKFLLRSAEQEFEAAQLLVFEFGGIFRTAQRPDEEGIENGFIGEVVQDRAWLVLAGDFIGEQGDCVLEVR